MSKEEKRYTVDDIDFSIPVHETPTYAKILQFAQEMYESQTDISITIIDDRFTIMGSMVEKEVIPDHMLEAKVGEKNK